MASLRNISLLLLSLGSFTASLHAQIWSEDFNSYGNATTQGAPKWTTSATDCDDGGNVNVGMGQSQWGVWGGQFTINDIEGAPCCPQGGGNDNTWLSEVIDIEDFCNITISMQVAASGVFECDAPGGPIWGCTGGANPDNSQDQVVMEYSLNGGGWVLFGYVCGDAGTGTITATGLNGTTLQIRFSAANKANAEFYYIDNIVVTGTTATEPTFNPIGPLCETGPPVALPTTSTGGITGTWTPSPFNPAGLGGTTTTVNFTPNAGQCATPTDMDIMVENSVDIMPAGIGPFCSNAGSIPLPNTVSGIAGTWSGTGVSGGSFNPATAAPGNNVLTFTPSPGECATPGDVTVVVTTAATPDLGTATLCEDDANLNLTTIQDPSYSLGTWSGTGVSGNSFDPSGLSGNVVLTFTSSEPCIAPATTSILVNAATTPAISGIPASICELAASIALPTNQGGINGTWSGSGVSGNNFDPTGLSGSVTLTFTPNAGQCADPATTSINVNAATTPAISGVPASICELAASIALPTNQGGINGTWSGSGVSGNNFDPTGLSGSVTLTFNPNAGQCANPATTNINVNAATTPAISGVPASICELAASIALPTTQGGINGNWSGTGVSGNNFNPTGLSGSVTLTFTPNAGQCANPATTNINVNAATTPAIGGVPATICELAASIALPTSQGGINGNWSGTGVSGNNFNPTGLSGSVTLTFTPNAGQCANPATTNINVNAATTPAISGIPATICELAASIVLPTTQGGINGTWSGMGVTGNNFNPTGLSGSVTLTFTPNAGQCANPATTNINVDAATTPAISGVPTDICETAASIALPTNQGGINGNWSGMGVVGNNFDPTGLNGNVTLTFTPNAGQCADPATTIIDVAPSVAPAIGGVPASLCETATPIALPTTQDGVMGEWSGVGVVGNTFDPTGLNGNVTLTFTPDVGFCASNATWVVNVGMGISPTISGVPASICETAPPLLLPNTQSGITGTWSGVGVFGDNFDPTGLSGDITLTFTPDASFCASPATTTITVEITTTPTISGIPASICETSLPISLPTNQGGVTGTWSGTGVLNNNFDPAGLSGNITLTFTPDASFCADVATWVINVGMGSAPTISGIPASICETAAAIALPTTQSGVTGIWSGMGVAGNNFDPAGLNGNITLTFTPDASFCANNATWVINVGTGTTPTISGVPATICQSAVAIALPTTQSGVVGTWSGTGVTGNNFDPTGLSGNITLTFTPNAGACATAATTVITVNASATPTLGTTTLCQSAGPFSLSGLNDPNYPAGAWSGPGVSGGNFTPTGQSGTVTLTFTPSANCVNQATTTITVNVPVSPTLGTASICESESSLSLAPLADPNYPNGSWSGPGVSGGSFDPNGQNGAVTVTFTPSANCTTASTTTVTVNGAPNFTGLIEPCDATNTTYTVSFNLTGGTAPYTVDGVTVAGSTFTSAPIISGTGYSFVIDDAAGCGPVTASGTENCLCSTDAGTMNLTGGTQTLCYGDLVFSVPFNQDENLDGDDLLQFVLHDNPGATLGNVIAISDSPVFAMPPGLTLGQTYYVSAVAGNDNGNGTIDLDDPCLSVTQGAPVVFYLPSVTLGNDATICASDCYDIPLQFTGMAPFLVDYTVYFNGLFVASLVADNLASSSTIEFCPSDYGITNGAIEVEITGMSDDGSCVIIFTANPPVAPSLTITVGNSVVNNLSSTLCTGETIVVNGTQYDETNPTGTETFPGGSFSGCDSVVNINLAFYPLVSSTIDQHFCGSGGVTVNGTVYDENNPTGTEVLQDASTNGCDSTVFINLTFSQDVTNFITDTLCTGGSMTVNGTIYDENNPTGTEVIVGGSSDGCDSTIVVNLSFNSVVTALIDPTLCPDESVTVNGTVYNAANPTGTQTMPGGSFFGCDSVAVVNLSFYPPAEFDLTQTLCEDESITVNGTVYDAGNPSGTEIIQNGGINGCDSTIYITLDFAPPANESITQTICPGESITVGSTVFDQNNPSGSVVLPNASYLGCDSTVTVGLSFYPISSSTIDDQFCTGGSITVNGTVYDESNPTGTEVLQNASTNGCDSTVFINLTFGSSVIVTLDPTLCPDETIIVDGTTYSTNNPTGSVTFPGGSYLGCDSTININLSFYPDAMGNITEILQAGGFIVVNGTVYDEQNPTGTEIFMGASYFGCDSTVVVNLTFENEVEELDVMLLVNSPLCQFANDGSIVIENITGGTPPYVVALNGSNSAPVVNFPVVFDMLTFGFHTLTILDAAGVVTTQEVFMPDALPVELNMSDELLIVPLGNSVTLSFSSTSNIATWTWSPPTYLDCTTCPAPISTPLNDITYTLAVTDENGCTAEGEVSVVVEKVQEVYVPNAFSPNNDGINDELTVFTGPQVERIKGFQIFSRWGELVFETYDFQPNDLQLGWNGTFKDKIMDPAVFVWVVEVLFLDGQTRLYKGDATLMR